MITINLNDRDQYPPRVLAGDAQVWTKASWLDPFALRPDLTPVQSVWTLAPDVSTATLEYRFGRVLVPGSSEYSTLSRITARGYWVLIRWRSDNGSPIDWLGYAETPVTRERYPARDSLPETGLQTIPCFGLMRALEQTWIDSTVYADPEDDSNARRSGGTGSTFNEGMRGNRSSEKRSVDGSGPTAYVFTDPNDDESQWWSTRDIVEHLAAFHLPTPMSVPIDGGVPWQINNLHVLPNWDRPSIDSDLRDVASILSELVEPSKMLSWGIGITGVGSTPPIINAVTINPFSLLAEPLTLPAGTLVANPTAVHLAAADDPLTTVEIDQDASGVVDQIIVQGPREISVCTLSAHPADKSTHEKGWTEEDRTKYEDGARFFPGFAVLSLSDKRDRNERFRTTGKLRDVYSLYRFKREWDGKNQNEFLFEPAKDEGGEDVAYIPAPLQIEMLDYLPLYQEVNYMAAPKDVDESNGLTLRQPVFSLRERNADGTLSENRIYVDSTGRLTLPDDLLKARPFQLAYELEDGLNLRIIVTDAPQHAIAGKEFVGNMGDVDQETVFGDMIHSGWEITLAIRGDRRPRYSIPSPEALEGLDVVRRKVVTLDDDSLASVWIAKNTVVGWANGVPNSVKSPGGLLRDPKPILESICRMLAKQHGQPRNRATIKTGRRLPQLELGMMIRSIDTADGPVDAPICEIRIDAPTVSGDGAPQGATQSFVASPYRADVMSLLRSTGTTFSTARRSRKGQKRIIKPRAERRPLVPRSQRMARRNR